MKRLYSIMIVCSLYIIQWVAVLPADALALRPIAAKSPEDQRTLKNLETSIGGMQLTQNQHNIATIQEEAGAIRRVELLADYANTDETIQRTLLRKKDQLGDIFVDMLYLLDFAGGKQIGFSLKYNMLGSDTSKEVYSFNIEVSLNEESIDYRDFLDKKITLTHIGKKDDEEKGLLIDRQERPDSLDIGTEMTVEEYFKREGIWGFVQKGLPSEIAGAFYQDEATRGVFICNSQYR